MKRNALAAITLIALSLVVHAQPAGDSALASVQAADRAVSGKDGDLPLLDLDEHMKRADVYMSNRQFPSARAHWQKVLENYPDSDSMPKALFGMGRSNMWERNYETAIEWFDRLVRDHTSTPDGQEGLAFKGACYVRLSKNIEAARTYEQYTVMFPNGKRIESSFLNIIDAYREAAEYDLANQWVEKTVKRFPGTATETNALHARLRMEVYRANWDSVISAADELLANNRFSGSMAFEYEVVFLKAFALEKKGEGSKALSVYESIPASPTSYFGGLATDRIAELGGDSAVREAMMKKLSADIAGQFPVVYQRELLRFGKERNVDPRFLLAIMKQESSFRPRAKSPAAARGLLQLTFDTALKFNEEAGYSKITATSLYSPTVNIAIGTTYIAKLKDEFGGLYEAIAASYNGGEDNAARWLARSNPRERAIFASEVGFSETKRYVFKVMGNYRVYRELYDENLVRRK